MTQPGIERRRAQRANVDLPIILSPRNQGQSARLTNVSSSGLGCTFPEPIPEMTLVGIELELPSQSGKTQLNGVVVRCEKQRGISPPSYEVGIFLTEISNEARKALNAFVDSQLQPH